MINADVLGIYPNMLHFRGKRAEVLASNIANVDTPNYKARDLTFHAALSELEGEGSGLLVEQMYRIPMQRSRDGNTVELHIEQAQFAENTMRYNQSMQFMKSRISGIQSAIKGK